MLDYTERPSTTPIPEYVIEGVIYKMYDGNRNRYLRDVECARRALERPAFDSPMSTGQP